ncbi:MAG: 30S ribosomal protein S12 methylthiotransferase RimO [Clostridia bacterium]|nr:30S ribosomal protein S12 methylthiotransferase RimO [Clostridia bacterium]
MSNKVYIETLGCPKNFNDTEVFSAGLLNAGYEITDNPESADIIIVNTCAFINDAKKESIDRIFDMASFNKKLVVSGCLAERYHNELMEEMPEVDLFVGVNDYERLPMLLKDQKCRYDAVSSIVRDYVPLEERKLEKGQYTATIKIAEGCDNKCAYCVIPGIRGKFRSKKKEDVIKETEYLASLGIKELILIAQDVTNYGMDIYGHYALPELVKEICRVDGIEWVRLMYCYEDRITDELIQVMRDEDKVCKYIDIPIQHASDAVLNSMKRRSTKESITDKLERLRTNIPDIRIRTTLIVGFPGETEEDFDELYDFVESARFARLGVFAYSQEENTVAGEMENQIDEEIKNERLESIMELQREISFELNKEFIGKTVKVLVEGEDEDGSYYGRTEYDAPEIDNSVLFSSEKKLNPGDFVNVYIKDAYDYDLVGECE